MSVALTRNELIENNLGLVHHIANNFKGTKLHHDDLFSIGCIGLIKAADSYRQDKGVKFATFASPCIRNEILMGLRKIKNEYLEISIDTPIAKNEEDNEVYLQDLIGTATDFIHDTVNEKNVLQGLSRAIQKLDEREQLLVNRYLASHKNSKAPTQRDMAKKLGCSQSYFSRLESKAIQKLGSILESECIFV